MDIGGQAAPTGNILMAVVTVPDLLEIVRHRFLLLARGQPDPVLERRLDATRWEFVMSRADLRHAEVVLAVRCAARRVGSLEDARTLGPGRALREKIGRCQLPWVSVRGHSVAAAVA